MSCVIVTGSSGLIGTSLTRALEADGIRVVRLVRRVAHVPDEVEWDPGSQPLDPAVLDGARAIVNLNGASIGRLPWTRGYREALRSSRILPTRTLATALRELGSSAPHLLSASAVGIYGSRPGENLTEESVAGSGFLAELCADWEAEALAAGARVTLLRTASVLHPEAVLKPLMPLTRWGVSGPLGGGQQTWPWISLADEVRAIRRLIDQPIPGAVNLCAPEQSTANEIGRELAQRLHRPFLLPVPGWALRMVVGRAAADALLLSDAAVAPRVLAQSGFEFSSPSLAMTLDEVID